MNEYMYWNEYRNKEFQKVTFIKATGGDAVIRAPTERAEVEAAVGAHGEPGAGLEDDRLVAELPRAVGDVAHCGEARLEQHALVALEEGSRHVRAHVARHERRVAGVRRALEFGHVAVLYAPQEVRAEALAAEQVAAALHSHALDAGPLAQTHGAVVRRAQELLALLSLVVVDEERGESLARRRLLVLHKALLTDLGLTLTCCFLRSGLDREFWRSGSRLWLPLTRRGSAT